MSRILQRQQPSNQMITMALLLAILCIIPPVVVEAQPTNIGGVGAGLPGGPGGFGGGGGGAIRTPEPTPTGSPTAPTTATTLLPTSLQQTLQPTRAPIVEGSLTRVFFTLQYGFEALSVREPTLVDMTELMCITNRFMADKTEQHIVEAFNNTRPVQAFATNIDWTYNATDPYLQVTTTFLADIRYMEHDFSGATTTREDDSVFVDKDIIFESFVLDETEVSEYITGILWKQINNPQSPFFDTIRVNYNVRQAPPNLAVGKMEEATCPGYTRVPSMAPVTPMPSVAPSVSPAPTRMATTSVRPSSLPSFSAAPSIPPSIAPSMTPSIQETVAMDAAIPKVYFKMEVLIQDDTRGVEPPAIATTTTTRQTETEAPILKAWTSADVEVLLCHTHTFMESRLQTHTKDPTIAMMMPSNVYWITSKTESASAITAYFTVDATVDTFFVDASVIVSSLEGPESSTATNRDLMKYLQVAGARIDDDLMKNIVVATVEDLPEDTPVRAGRLQIGVCPTFAPTLSPTVATTDSNGNTGDGSGGNNGSGNGSGGIGNDNGIDNGGKADGDNFTGDPSRAGDLLYEEPTMTIQLEFMVSNLDFLISPTEVLEDSGLVRSFPIFMADLVPKLQDAPANSNLRRALQDRNLHEYGEITLMEGSARAYRATQVECGAFVHPDSTCHNVDAKFELIMPVHEDHDDADPTAGTKAPTTQEDANDIRRIYQVATYRAILDGTFYEATKKEEPNTSIFIGTIPDGSNGGNSNGNKSADWLIIVLSVLVGILCCCILACLCHRCWEARHNKELEEDIDHEMEMLRQEEEIERELQAQHERRESQSEQSEQTGMYLPGQSMHSERSMGQSERSMGQSLRSERSMGQSLRSERSTGANSLRNSQHSLGSIMENSSRASLYGSRSSLHNSRRASLAPAEAERRGSGRFLRSSGSMGESVRSLRAQRRESKRASWFGVI